MKSQDILTGMIRSLGPPVGSYSEKDVATVVSRVRHEGDAFLEITLPRLDDLLLAGLRDGFLPQFEGWKLKKGWSHPEFLHGFWKRIFNPDGSLRPAACSYSVLAIRQVSRAFKKVFENCSDSRIESAIRRFNEVDRDLSQVRIPPYVETLSQIAHYLFGEVVGSSIIEERTFRHGPGAVAERYDSLARWDFPSISSKVDELVGAETFRATWGDLLDRPPAIIEIPARLVAVPKTAVKPRLISVEPSYNQFLQQGLHTLLKAGLSRFPVCDITNQERNKDLARLGSQTGRLATIDLSDASDRVHYGLLKSMFSWNPQFLDFLESTRSRVIETPLGTTLLNKFASMGSALTFPVETMFFTVIVIYTMCEVRGDFSRRYARSLLYSGELGVYGDDIVIPSSIVPTLTRRLEECGLAVNREKSFHQGGFRESCGGDYWGGINVTPVYVRRRMPQSTHDVTELVSLSSFRNLWVARYGYGPLSMEIDQFISKMIPYPAGLPSQAFHKDTNPNGGICRVGPDDCPEGRWSQTMFRREVKMMVPVGVRKDTVWSSTSALFKTLYEGYNRDPLHLTHHGRPVSAKLKYRWVGNG